MEEACRDPEGDDLGIDYTGGAAAEEQVGLQYDKLRKNRGRKLKGAQRTTHQKRKVKYS
jgi:hypothetical protein